MANMGTGVTSVPVTSATNINANDYLFLSDGTASAEVVTVTNAAFNSGTTGPDGLIPAMPKITWDAGSGETYEGWKLCVQQVTRTNVYAKITHSFTGWPKTAAAWAACLKYWFRCGLATIQ